MAVINHSIGMDIGGTNTVVGIVSHEGKVVARDAVKTKDYPILEDYVEAVSQKIEAMLCDCSLTGGDVRGLGIGAPNADCYRGTIEHAPNLPWQGEGLPLGDMFSRRLGIVVRKITYDAMEARLMPIFRGKTKVLLSEMKDADAALLGASALV